MTLNPDFILQVRNLSKSFSGVKALDHVQLDLRRGEVHALMGENGAGKSTFMKILVGLLSPDTGEIVFEGETLHHAHVRDLLKKGISMIHQEILLVPELTVAQNIFLGQEPSKRLLSWLKDDEINKQTTELLHQIGADISPKTKMKYLSVAQMQMVEIAKAIANKSKVIIMDEPTSAISEKEVEMLFKLIQDLKQKGVAIVYISHKMDEIYTIADTITVLRDGKYITTKPATELDRKNLIALMVGREIETLYPDAPTNKGEIMLSVKNLTSRGKFSAISFDVYQGEVVGLAGLMGAGRSEIARAIYGLDKYDSGEILIKGTPTKISSAKEAVKNGIGYVSEDRKGWGFIPALSVKHNLSLASIKNHTKNGWINTTTETQAAKNAVEELKIKAATLNQSVIYLSGGNQQKVVIGKVLATNPTIVILDEPTRGVDVGAKFEIYKLINQLKSKGIAIIMISSELPEIIGMSDRVVVLSKGKQTATFDKQQATQENIMHYAVH